jgi:hypothetical protein
VLLNTVDLLGSGSVGISEAAKDGTISMKRSAMHTVER